MAKRIRLRGDSIANWVSENPILAQREVGVELETNKHKIGDGTTHWNDLDYPTYSKSEIETMRQEFTDTKVDKSLIDSTTGNYTLPSTATVLFVDTTSGNINVTMPNATGCEGIEFIINRVSGGSNKLYINTQSAQKINGDTQIIISSKYVSITLMSDGSNFHII